MASRPGVVWDLVSAALADFQTTLASSPARARARGYISRGGEANLTGSSVAASVTDTSRAAEARRLALGLATEAGFDEGDIGKVALIVTEAATNLFKHATEGQLIVQPLCSGNASGLEIMAVDRGPGIANVHECLRDGYSTSGSPGTGLGAISRLSSTFDIYSAPGRGTTLFSEIRKTPGAGEPSVSAPASRVRMGCVSIAKPGED